MSASDGTRGAAAEVLMQLFVRGPIWDGNLVSKSGRDDLVEAGFVDRVEGWNFLTRVGVRHAVFVGQTQGRDWHDQSWYKKASLQ